MFRLSGFALVLIAAGGVLAVCQEARQTVHLQNPKDTGEAQPPNPVKDGSRVEVESVEIGPAGAIPAEIHRPAGKFIVLLINRSHDPAASFVVDPAAIGDGLVGQEPLLRLADAALASKHRLAGLIDLPAGGSSI